MRTCAQYGVPPLLYLTEVLGKLARRWAAARLEELLPHRWRVLDAAAQNALGRRLPRSSTRPVSVRPITRRPVCYRRLLPPHGQTGRLRTAWAGGHLLQWLCRASHSRLGPFKKLARMLRTHLDGLLVWTRLRVSNGALEGMNNKVKVISHRAYGYRTTWTYIANIYHCCAGLPLP
jgi:Transposase